MSHQFNPFTGKLDIVQDLSGYVPYTGATQNLDLGSHDLITLGNLQGEFKSIQIDDIAQLSGSLFTGNVIVRAGFSAENDLTFAFGVKNLAATQFFFRSDTIGGINYSRHFLPLTSATYDLGGNGDEYEESNFYWRDLFLLRNISDGTNSLTVANAKAAHTYSQVGHLPLAGGTMAGAINMNGNDITNSGTININATSDHQIYNTSDNLYIKNPNSNKAIYFNINKGGTNHDFIKIDGSNTQFLISNNSSTSISDGIMKVTGTWSTGIAAAAMTFEPTISSGNFFGFYIKPIINTSSAFTALAYQPSFGSNIRSVSLLNFSPTTAYAPGYANTYNRYSESFSRTFFNFSANDSTAIAYNPFDIGGAITLGDLGYTNVAVTETMIKLSGGSVRSFGTGGSITQKGIVFSGFGTIASNTTVRAMEADGGLFSYKYDYSTTSRLLFGGGEDAAIGYDGTDFVIDTALVGSGVVKFANATNWTANGTANVTISNVAPAGVGTATISKWFTVKDDTGTVYYIPAWT